MRWLFLLPWGLFLLGLAPLALAEPLGQVGRGLCLLLAALLLAAAGSLDSRFPMAFSVQFFLVLGLGLLAFQLALESAPAFAGSGYRALGGILGALALAIAFFLGTGREAPLLPALGGGYPGGPPAPGPWRGWTLGALWCWCTFPPPPLPRGCRRSFAGGTWPFAWREGIFWSSREAGLRMRRGWREGLRSGFPFSAYAVERRRGGSLEGVLARLEAEALLQS